MRVTLEADVDGFGGGPELIEAGIEVEVHAHRDRFDERPIGEQPRNVDEGIASCREGTQSVVRQSHGFLRAGHQERRTGCRSNCPVTERK